MAETITLEKAEELGIAIDSEMALLTSCLLGIAVCCTGVTISDLMANAATLYHGEGVSLTETIARTACIEEAGHVCRECSFQALGPIAVNEADLWISYDCYGLGLGIDYRISGIDTVVAGFGFRASVNNWTEAEVLEAIYGDDAMILGTLIGGQPLDCVADAANDATQLPFEIDR